MRKGTWVFIKLTFETVKVETLLHRRNEKRLSITTIGPDDFTKRLRNGTYIKIGMYVEMIHPSFHCKVFIYFVIYETGKDLNAKTQINSFWI